MLGDTSPKLEDAKAATNLFLVGDGKKLNEEEEEDEEEEEEEDEEEEEENIIDHALTSSIFPCNIKHC